MKLVKLNEPDLLYVCDNMRELDRREIYATRWTDNPVHLVDSIMIVPELGWVAKTDDDVPVAAIGVVPMWDGVWSVWMFATDNWPEVSLSVTKFIKRALPQAMNDAGIHRAQCYSSAEHTVAHAWLRMLGADKESEIKAYGKNGEDFILFSWIKHPSKTHS